MLLSASYMYNSWEFISVKKIRFISFKKNYMKDVWSVDGIEHRMLKCIFVLNEVGIP